MYTVYAIALCVICTKWMHTEQTQGGQLCRQSPQVANWPWKCDDKAHISATCQTKES
jgi:hypothetical protein